MSATATATPPPIAPVARRAPRLFETGGDTLENAILRAWDELAVEGRVACPVCSGEMTAAAGCSACGSELL